MLQHTAGIRTVGKEARTVLLAGKRHAHGIFCHCNRGVPDQAVKTKSRNMKHILRPQFDIPRILEHGILVGIPRIHVINPTTVIPVHIHLVGEKRIQPKHPSASIPHDLRIGISPNQKVAHQRFPEHKGSHLRVRFIVEQKI